MIREIARTWAHQNENPSKRKKNSFYWENGVILMGFVLLNFRLLTVAKFCAKSVTCVRTFMQINLSSDKIIVKVYFMLANIWIVVC